MYYYCCCYYYWQALVTLVCVQWRGSERVNAAAVSVLSVVHGGVPTHRPEPPASVPPGLRAGRAGARL